MRKGILKKHFRSLRKAAQEKFWMPQRELSLKTWVFEKTFHFKCVLKIPALFYEFGRFTFEPTRVRDYHEPWVKHEPTSSQAPICYFLSFLSFMATEKQF